MKIIDAFWEKRNLTHTPRVSFRISREKGLLAYFYIGPFVCQSAFTSAAPTGWISMKFETGGLLRNSVEELRTWLKPDNIIGHFTC